MPRQERRLYDICLLCSDMGMPLNVEQVRHLVKDYFDANSWQSPTFKDNFPGPTWAFNFIKRFPALTLRLAENKRRIEGTLTAEDLDRYFDRLKPNLEGVPRCRILNMDETRCTMDVWVFFLWIILNLQWFQSGKCFREVKFVHAFIRKLHELREKIRARFEVIHFKKCSKVGKGVEQFFIIISLK